MALPGLPPVPPPPSSTSAPQAAESAPWEQQSQQQAPAASQPQPVTTQPPPPPAAVQQQPVQEAAPPAAPEPAPAPAPVQQTPAPTPVAPPAPATEQHLAPTNQGDNLPTVQGGNTLPGVAQIEQLLAEDGFSGLNLDGFGTFPTIVLNDGAFRYSGGEEIGPEFIVRIMSSRAKFLYKTDLPDNDPRGEVAYSYDNTTNTNGTPLEEIFDGWRQKGLPVKNTPVVYTEVQGQMDDGKVVLLSIPKTSSSVLGAYLVQLRMNGKKGSDVWTRCFKGPTVTRAVKPFTPWAFSVAS